ncbi:replication-associated recombination protein A [Wohlfahrtiimonas chitiniclastica]|uniref:replication-associated recombination protein A n=1 Tax=Wohlfahrtiimonas chitiniclastica TaxID=400946 RepID=UPI0007B696A8|nr:replication-associated recombination protein A [Wohlfahrtiimonas chitiniclastica]KZX37327.1 recombination factor protein RarA [Wohlfahrtiimonas chitiniclastica]
MRQNDLFSTQGDDFAPLADRLRPQSLEDVVGQRHLIGKDKPLTLALNATKPHSMIFWGPPGVGKTTLARLLAHAYDCQFIALSAVFSGVKEIREAIETAKNYQLQGKQTILFIDEIHRFNKSQQDALLPYIESGLVVFVGATTENPSFEINRALLSRATVYPLKPIDAEALTLLVERVLTQHYPHIQLAEDAVVQLVTYADGDARRLLNRLEQVLNIAESEGVHQVTTAFLGKVLTAQPKAMDKGGDQFYDLISALHKSVRGSDPDAALYWFMRMLEGGTDPRYLARRIVRIAWEDIGIADPRAMQIANDAATTYERLGSPEGELALSTALVYLACAAKSNAAYNAFNQARAFVRQDQSREVPLHLRNAPTQLMADMDYGKAYRYAHSEPYAYAAGEKYFPDDLPDQQWYQPTDRGLERKIQEKLAFLAELDKEYQRND